MLHDLAAVDADQRTATAGATPAIPALLLPWMLSGPRRNTLSRRRTTMFRSIDEAGSDTAKYRYTMVGNVLRFKPSPGCVVKGSPPRQSPRHDFENLGSALPLNTEPFTFGWHDAREQPRAQLTPEPNTNTATPFCWA